MSREAGRRLDRLLRPRSIAVIGGGVWGRDVVLQSEMMGFEGPIWPVHPSKAEVGGRACYRSVADLPGAPDAVFVGVNRAATVQVVGELAGIGAGGAVCFASGFAEAVGELADGGVLQSALLDAAGDMPILGPNCYGLINALDCAVLWPDQHGLVPVPRGVGLVTQSSNIAINLTMQARGLPIAMVATAGNQAQLGLSEIAMAMLQDSRVTALGLHIEGVDDLSRFQQMAQMAHDLGKPVVALKIGVSEAAQVATISHTASLAGSAAGAQALFKRLGIAQAESLAGMLETLKLLHIAGPLKSANIVSLSCSGGEASLMADAVVGTGLQFPALSNAQKDALRAALGPRVALANPLDYHTYIWGDLPAMTACYAGMMARADLGMGVIVVDFPRPDRCSPEAWEPVLVAAKAAQDITGTPVALLASLPDTLAEDIANRIVDMGMVPLCGVTEGVAAMDAAARLGAHRSNARPCLKPQSSALKGVLDEAEAKVMLAHHGVPVPKSLRTDDPVIAADALGYPVVLKGEGVAHKTEAGAVALNLPDANAVRTVADAMPCSHFLVEEMIRGTVAELLIGVLRDPAHGYVLTLAAGGVLSELLQDSVSLLVPASEAEIVEALDALRLGPVLRGYRGKPGADIAAIVLAVQSVQDFVQTHHPAEVEINPLLCQPKGAVAADALIRGDDP